MPLIEIRKKAFIGCDQVNPNDTLCLHVLYTSIQQCFSYPLSLISRIHGKIIDLKGPAVMEEQGCINPIILTHFLSNYRQNQNPYTSMPSTAEMPMSMTGDRPCFFIFAGIK